MNLEEMPRPANVGQDSKTEGEGRGGEGRGGEEVSLGYQLVSAVGWQRLGSWQAHQGLLPTAAPCLAQHQML